jgi:hypothetical protein
MVGNYFQRHVPGNASRARKGRILWMQNLDHHNPRSGAPVASILGGAM